MSRILPGKNCDWGDCSCVGAAKEKVLSALFTLARILVFERRKIFSSMALFRSLISASKSSCMLLVVVVSPFRLVLMLVSSCERAAAGLLPDLAREGFFLGGGRRGAGLDSSSVIGINGELRLAGLLWELDWLGFLAARLSVSDSDIGAWRVGLVLLTGWLLFTGSMSESKLALKINFYRICVWYLGFILRCSKTLFWKNPPYLHHMVSVSGQYLRK